MGIFNTINMKKALLLIFFTGVALVFGYFLIAKEGVSFDQKVSPNIPNADKDIIRFEGVITDSTNGCWIESGVCYIEVDTKWVIAVVYGLNARRRMPDPMGEVVGIDTTKEDIGKKVEVYAKKVNETDLTIYGSKEYYVRVTGE